MRTFLIEDEDALMSVFARAGFEKINKAFSERQESVGNEKFLADFNVYVTKEGRVFKRRGSTVYEFSHNICNKGYHRIHVTQPDDKKNNFGAHRLVAMAYIPNPENKPDVNHIDGNPGNNTLENLEWVTKSENLQHSLKRRGIASRSRGVIEHFNDIANGRT